MIELHALIQPDCILHPLTASEPHGVIRELVQLLHARNLIADAEETADAVWAREQQRSTGIGDGIAVPHGRCEHMDQIVAAIGTADPAIDFQASDGKAVNLVVLLVSPTRNTTLHVQALGAISRRLGHAEIRRRLRNCPDAGCVYDVLCRAD